MNVAWLILRSCLSHILSRLLKYWKSVDVPPTVCWSLVSMMQQNIEETHCPRIIAFFNFLLSHLFFDYVCVPIARPRKVGQTIKISIVLFTKWPLYNKSSFLIWASTWNTTLEFLIVVDTRQFFGDKKVMMHLLIRVLHFYSLAAKIKSERKFSTTFFSISTIFSDINSRNCIKTRQ